MTKSNKEYQRRKLAMLIIDHPDAEVIFMADRDEDDSFQAYTTETIQYVEYTRYAFYRDTLFTDPRDLARDMVFHDAGDEDHIGDYIPDAENMMRDKAIVVWLTVE